MILKKLTDDELLIATDEAVHAERDAITSVIRHFQEIYDRRLYLPRYTSMFEMLRDKYSYCAGSAQIRLNAMKLIREVPAVEAKIESGEMSLSVAANVQSFLQAETKLSRPYSQNAKAELIEACTGKSVLEVDREFARRNPEIEKRESVRFTSEDRVRISHSLSIDVEEKIQRIKEIWSHVDPNMSREQILDRMSEIVLDQIDPLRKAKRSEERKQKLSRLQTSKPVTAAVATNHNDEVVSSTPTKQNLEDSNENQLHVHETDSDKSCATDDSLHPHETSRKRSRYITADANKAVHLENNGEGCAFVDVDTGKRCRSRFQLQRDHIVPYANGGSNRPLNLRILCAQHNRWCNRPDSLVRPNRRVDRWRSVPACFLN